MTATFTENETMEASEPKKLELTDKQKHVLYKLITNIRDKNIIEQTLGGYAGTGKSTLIRYISHFFPDYAIAAYTGKAANVLRRKGMAAQTIHSLIYKPEYEWGRLIGWELVPRSEFPFKGILIDESSMVSEDIYRDLGSYGLPSIYVGDHGQLEPIGSGFNLMKNPMHRLEEIHRNAGDIAKFSERLRFGYKSTSFGSCDKVHFKNHRRLTADDYCEVDQVICAFNKTRVGVNKQVRANLGYTGTLNEGERIMCLKNNKTLGLFNGMQGIVRRLYECDHSGRQLLDFEFDGTLYPGIWYDSSQFGKEKPDFEIRSKEYPNPFDYAYCITAHKAQGDEFEKVCVIEQKCEHWDHKRWAYTAASRAREYLLWGF
jgi:exodeoxyribonuclease-5